MEFPRPLLSVILTVVAVMTVSGNYGGVAAQAPPQSSGCATSLLTLSPCVGYITSNVTTSPPTQGCCTALSSVVQNSAVCLCQLLTTNNPLGFPINQTRALALPGACKITTPPLTQCKVSVSAPAPSPSTDSNNAAPPATESVPSTSPAPATSTSTPSAVSPSAKSPSFVNPPTTSVGGISPAANEGRSSNAVALFTPSTIISVLAGAIVAGAMW
ncbi:hypothetical protein KI387_033199 [Taxus chinensis]|uniref:Bifunctional inhibitor/plant lipid transfer protein/seed storage helical domain-containing protein n=1 Tax=Taxus chinensis TaxID=29808 RepID=A0AA38BTV9_TAXCH|nr:hypothetical protein KI387_033199 [Taxus chinensis]